MPLTMFSPLTILNTIASISALVHSSRMQALAKMDRGAIVLKTGQKVTNLLKQHLLVKITIQQKDGEVSRLSVYPAIYIAITIAGILKRGGQYELC